MQKKDVDIRHCQMPNNIHVHDPSPRSQAAPSPRPRLRWRVLPVKKFKRSNVSIKMLVRVKQKCEILRENSHLRNRVRFTPYIYIFIGIHHKHSFPQLKDFALVFHLTKSEYKVMSKVHFSFLPQMNSVVFYKTYPNTRFYLRFIYRSNLRWTQLYSIKHIRIQGFIFGSFLFSFQPQMNSIVFHKTYPNTRFYLWFFYRFNFRWTQLYSIKHIRIQGSIFSSFLVSTSDELNCIP